MSLTSGNIYIDALIGDSWKTKPVTGVVLTYSFMTKAPTDVPDGDVKGFLPMTAAQETGAEKAIAAWAAVANITLIEFTSDGDIQLGTSDQSDVSGGFAYLPDGGLHSSYLFTSNTEKSNFTFEAGGYGLMTMIHELGHTLGLKHPGDYNAGGEAMDGPFLPTAYDNADYSIMSYNDSYGYDYQMKYPSTPMLLDIQAMQYLYGANNMYHIGSDTYRFTNETAPQCVWDAGGTDTFDFSACTGETIIDLNEGSFSSTMPDYFNVSVAYNVTIERAIAGNGGSIIYANDNGNVIQGGKGEDWVFQGLGNDTITGGGGNDKVFFSKDLSTYTISGTSGALKVTGEGTDTLSAIGTLEFDDRTIKLSDYAVLQGGTAIKNNFNAVAGNELVTGGGGIDTDSFNGARANYQITADGGDFKITDKTGNGGTDLLSGVERLYFSAGAGVALDIDGAAGQTYRLYQAAFNRKPDAGGVGFWLDQLDHGLGLLKMAQFFLDSPESVRTYGALDNTAFVNVMYANVLHRAPDASGLKFYLDGFTAGAFSRAQVLQGFSESPENQAAVIGSITNGVEFTVV